MSNLISIGAFQRDDNGIPIDELGLSQTKQITYVGTTTGATGPTTLFTVTGIVGVSIFGIVSGANLTGSGTLEVGITGNTAALIAQTIGTSLDIGGIWTSATPGTVETYPSLAILNGTDIIQTIATNTITAGTITYYCQWYPISTDGKVVAA